MNICIIEDNEELLANLRLLLGGESGCRVIGAFNSAEAALAQAPWEQCEVLLVDIDLPGISGVDLIRQLHPQHPHVQILVHTISENRATVFAALKAGAMGYLLKGSSPRDLIESLRTLFLGGAPMSPRIARKVILELRGQSAGAVQAGLTPRELAVLNGISQGSSYKQLADQLGLSSHTIHSHIKRAYEKLQATDRNEALQKARCLGVI